MIPEHIVVKRCGRCREVKLIAEFYRDNASSDGLQGSCQICQKETQKLWWNPQRRRKAKLKESHNLTLEQYQALVEKQLGLCAICHKPPSQENPKEMLLHVDHDHDTGEIRGLLCNCCNRGIGMLGDSAETLLSAHEYLKRCS